MPGASSSALRPLGQQQPDQVQAADRAGDDADRQLGRARTAAARRGRWRPAAKAPISAAGSTPTADRAGRAAWPAAARPARRTRSGPAVAVAAAASATARTTTQDPGPFGPDAQRAGGVVAHLQQAERAGGRPSAAAGRSAAHRATGQSWSQLRPLSEPISQTCALIASSSLAVTSRYQLIAQSIAFEPDADQHQPVADRAPAHGQQVDDQRRRQTADQRAAGDGQATCHR